MTQDEYTLEEALGATIIPLEGGALRELRTAEVDQACESARANPRSIRGFINDLVTMVTLDQDTAAECIYSVPRAGKKIQGPSVRFAELVQCAWGNIDVSTTIMEIGDTAVVIRGRAHDLQKNSSVGLDVRRLVQKKKNSTKADEDQKQLAVASGTSIAKRNAILSAVPRALWWRGYQAALEASTGGGTMTERRTKAREVFLRLGATEEQTLALVNRPAWDDVDDDDLRYLAGLRNAIKSKEFTIEDALRKADAAKEPQTQASSLADQIEKSAARQRSTAPQSDEVPAFNPETGEVYKQR